MVHIALGSKEVVMVMKIHLVCRLGQLTQENCLLLGLRIILCMLIKSIPTMASSFSPWMTWLRVVDHVASNMDSHIVNSYGVLVLTIGPFDRRGWALVFTLAGG